MNHWHTPKPQRCRLPILCEVYFPSQGWSGQRPINYLLRRGWYAGFEAARLFDHELINLPSQTAVRVATQCGCGDTGCHFCRP